MWACRAVSDFFMRPSFEILYSQVGLFFCEHLHSSSSFFVRALVSIRLVLHSGIGDADGWLASVNLLPGQPDLFVALLVGECAEVENCCSHRTSKISLDPETLI